MVKPYTVSYAARASALAAHSMHREMESTQSANTAGPPQARCFFHDPKDTGSRRLMV